MSESKSSLTSQSTVPQRGTLQVVVTPSTRIISAGSSFSISVTITNPYDVPITVGSVTTVLPVDLYDTVLAVQLKEKRKTEQKLRDTRDNLRRSLGERLQARSWIEEGPLRPLIRSIFSFIPFFPADALTDMASTAVAHMASADFGQPNFNRFADVAAQLLEKPVVKTEQPLSPGEVTSQVEEMIRPLKDEYDKLYEEKVEQKVTLRPGNSITKVFTLRTRKGLDFRPTSYNLNLLVAYELDNATHTQALPYTLDIQASLFSVIIGAVLGAIFGVVAANPNLIEWNLATILPKVVSSLILSAFAVIAFARKEGVQPVIAIQDFWGGMFIGFLIGYSGSQVFGNLLSSSS